MAYILAALTAFQFLFRILGLQDSSFYLLANPYVFLTPFIFIWIGSVIVLRQPADKLILIAWILALLVPCLMLRNYSGYAEFALIFMRGLQFFWGPLLLLPALLGLFRMIGFTETTNDTARRFILLLAAITGSVTLFELVVVDVLGISPLIIPWVSHDPGAQDINPFRPWGLTSYPQPNALIMAFLFWLSFHYRTQGIYHKFVTFFGTIFSGSGTGIAALGLLAVTKVKRPLVVSFVGVMLAAIVAAWVLATQDLAWTGVIRGRLDPTYITRLADLFLSFSGRFFAHFTLGELLMGTNAPNMIVVTGLTRDWAYLDVFYAYGLLGVLGYILVYGTLIFYSIPPEAGSAKRAIFSFVALVLNFHYGTLNFFVGQFLFTSLAALQLNRAFSREVGRWHVAKVRLATRPLA